MGKKKIKIIEDIILGSAFLLCGTGIVVLSVDDYNTYHIEREIDEEGNYKIEGTVSYKQLEKYQLIEYINIKGEHRLMIGKELTNNLYKYEVEELFTGNKYKFKDEVVKTTYISNWLIASDEVKAEYTEEDLRRILSKIEADYVFENDKVKTK